MRALIIGCGYIGLCIGRRLAGQQIEVFGMRRSASGSSELQAAGIKPLIADLAKPDDLLRLDPCFDWVINTAAAGRGGGLAEYQQVYFEGTKNILSWLQSTPPQKYIYTSSTGVYGQDDSSWVTEESPTEPATPTGKVLVETERLLQTACREWHFPAVILRSAGIYGPGRGYAFQQFIRNEARLEGDGERVMNMVHQEDVAGATNSALQQGKPGEIYNVVDDEPVTQKDFYLWLSNKLGRPMPLTIPTGSVARKRGLTNKKISNQKLKSDLGYRFRYPTFREGYAELISAEQQV